MVVIRLQRGGANKRPFYHLVVADSRRAASGKFLERVGFYDPKAPEGREALRVDMERVKHWTGQGEALAAAKEWWIGTQAYRVREAKLHGAAVVGKLAGIETREQALALKGSAVSVQRGSLPEPGEGHYYLADLVGLEVVNERGEALGVVKRLFTNGAQDVMELAGERTRLLPW